jgi:protein translocase SecG subunit
MSTFTIIEVILALLLSAVVLVQQQSSGLGDAFGGTGSSYRSRRGIEKFWFYATIVLAIAFFGMIIASIVTA